MLKTYHEFNNFKTNENMKWLTTFILLANLGIVPPSVKSANAQTKMEFIDNLEQDKIDAALFVDWSRSKNLATIPFENAWDEFTKEHPNVKTNSEEALNNITKEGGLYDLSFTGKPDSTQSNEYIGADFKTFKPKNWVTDMANVFEAKYEAEMNNMIKDYEKKTSIEICVVTIPTLEGMVIEDYAQSTFDRLGIGKKGADNGILIIYSIQDRKTRIHTGYGIEPFLTDQHSSRILRNIIPPYFKKGEFSKGSIAAIKEIQNVLGDQAFEEMVRWKQEEADQLERERQAVIDEFMNFLSIGMMILTLIGIIAAPMYFILKKIKDKKERIRKILEYKDIIKQAGGVLDKLKSSIPKENMYDELSKTLKKSREYINEIAKKDIDIDDISDEEDELVRLETTVNKHKQLQNSLNNAIRQYQLKFYELREELGKIENLESNFNIGLQKINNAIKYWDKVKEYGYDPGKPINKEAYMDYKEQAFNIIELSKFNADLAISTRKEYQMRINRFIDSVNGPSILLSSILLAISEIPKLDSKIADGIRNINVYSKWERNNERADLLKKIDILKKDMDAIPDNKMLEKHKIMKDILENISDLGALWAKRKRDKEAADRREEEERRAKKRRAEEAAARSRSTASYSSSSYSSSSSSFGGFGGGRSGGGGSTGGW